MSKLIVEVCVINNIEPLPNADRMEMATIKGWNCLVGKGQHKPGDLAIFIPPDAVVPAELAADLKLDFLRENGRVRTIKLRGYISQGLVITFDQLAEGGHIYNASYKREGTDVADLLGITKYEVAQTSIAGPRKESIYAQWQKYQAKEITLRRFVCKTFAIIRDRLRKPKLTNPEFKVYTDIQNIKHYPVSFEPGEPVVIMEKIHGTNFRTGKLPVKQTFLNKIFNKNGYEFCYGSHRVQKTCLSGNGFYGEDVYGKIAARYGLKDLIPNGYVLYGEIYGPNIQELTYGVSEIDVVFFDLQIDGKYVDWVCFQDFCQARGLPIVPVLFQGEYNETVAKQLTDGLTLLGNGCHIREGVVIKPFTEKNDSRIGRKILKSISTAYLLSKNSEENPEFTH